MCSVWADNSTRSIALAMSFCTDAMFFSSNLSDQGVLEGLAIGLGTGSDE